MAKAILEFDLNEPDDRKAHLRCVKATDMAIAIWDILQIRREIEKYGKNKDMALNDIWSILDGIIIEDLID